MKRFYLMFFVFMTVCSCKNANEISGESSGKPNTVSIIIDDELWNGEIGDSIRNKFAAPVIGLPQEEPLFTINQYPVKLLEGFMTNSRNIIVIKKEAKSLFEITENEYAKPQNVVHISGKSVLEILDTLQNNSNKIIDKIKKTEIFENQKITKKESLNSKKINLKFKILIDIPKNYKYVMRRNKFVWLKKEISSGSLSLIAYETKYFDLNNNKKLINQIIKTRDSIGNLYIHGSARNTQLQTDNSLMPYLSKTIIDNNIAFETKGLWQMNNDFMSGPFINYNILDKKHNRILVLEGFCYAPSKEKRDFMFELESIIKSVNIK
jgi:Domain of unknown function (DUF4837)